MVSWGWIPICLITGVFIGVFLIALVQVSREEDEQRQKKGKWYDDL